MEEDVYPFMSCTAPCTCTTHVNLKPLATRTISNHSIIAPSHYSNFTFTTGGAFSVAFVPAPPSRMHRLWLAMKRRLR